MTSLAGERRGQIARQIGSESLIVYGLFATTLVLLVASGVTGWLEASRRAEAPSATGQELTRL